MKIKAFLMQTLYLSGVQNDRRNQRTNDQQAQSRAW